MANRSIVNFILKIMGECNETLHSFGVKYITWILADGHAFQAVAC